MRLVLALLSCLLWTNVLAQDSLMRGDTIREVSVRGHRLNSFLLDAPNGISRIDLRMMNDMPRILGNADPMHYAQLLPGVQTNSEYDAGLHVQGCDNAHNMVSINGVPLYNVSHLLGFFSIFNTPHFATMQLARSAANASMDNRLGAHINMLTADTIRPATSGDVSVGPISSQGTLRLPVGQHSLLTVSARQAYLNLLYGRWMKIETETIRYNFGDYNLSWLWQPNERHTISVDFYHGNDHASYTDEDYLLDTGLKWGNTMAALHMDSKLGHDIQLQQTLYYTHSYNKLNLDMSSLHVDVPSSISDVGYRTDLKAGALCTGLQVIGHSIQPQDPNINGMFDIDKTEQPRQHTIEGTAYADYTLQTGPVSTTAGLRTLFYQNGDYRRVAFDPVVTITYQLSTASQLILRSSLKHQYLHRSGFSDMGLPTEFWFSASQQYPAQYSWNISLGFETWFKNRMYHFTVDTYYKRLYHQQEYSGNVFDVLYSSYDLQSMLLHGQGYNYGINVLMEKRKGKLTGWLSYSWGRAMRSFSDRGYQGWYPANHERPHELNIMATYRLNSHWSFGGTYVFASGTPFTAPRKFYLLNESLVSVFGEHNANRLNPYMRVDLSVNYDFHQRHGRRSGINVSVYNLTMHENDIYYRLKIYQDRFAAKPFRFLLKIMPSVNYYYQF